MSITKHIVMFCTRYLLIPSVSCQCVPSLRSKDDTIAINMAAWTEIMVMSRAECLLASDSGFSLIALMMSDSHCFQQMYDCTREASNTLGSVPLHHRKLLNVN